ncbi:LysR family transcriptional regulator [Echinimonas agarilytica]|uniref:LysR family transcriptional regulator n=1 Tax=Echinimonas agarilytica TaxID=1215918 RepID=A0AA41W3Z1_9GAMM|nr:LysR family transcriptional regulator [Echinimonas agarilytica]MCM2678269.1 LysR family transcriptional regulator [Echinimonas agarilytica]
MKLPRVSLEQWAAFKAVVDCGSFAKAAEALNKSQSAISYSVGKLEQQLPTPALEQQGRKAALTEAGTVLYRHANNLLNQALSVEAHANYLASGWQAEVTIAVDSLVDMQPIICGLRGFSEQYPQTRIRLLETTLSATDDALLERQADMVYTPHVLPGFMGTPVDQFEMPCVVSPNHPMAHIEGTVSSDDMKQHRQVVVRDSGSRRSMDAGWLQAEQRWTVTYFGTSIRIVKQGLGFAFITEPQIEEELVAGTLVKLALPMESKRLIAIYRVLAMQEQSNPAVQAVAGFIDEKFNSLQRNAQR